MAPAIDKQKLVPLQGTQLVFVSAALGLASVMQNVDTTIANVSVPTIAGEFGVAADVGEWIITSFGIASAIVIPLTGWLSRRFGQVRLFQGSVLLFTVSSVLCGLAPSFSSLVVFRVLQGLVSGPLVPLSQALLIACFPPEKRTLAVATWAMTNMTGPVIGPLLGGWITEQYTWPWIFLVNVPIGLYILAAVRGGLAGRETEIKQEPVDYIGFVLLALGIGALQVMFDRGRYLDWFNSGFICLLAGVSVTCLVSLVVWELTHNHPIIDLALFSHRNFAVGTAAAAVGFGLYFGAIALIPLWLQTDMGYTATAAGLSTAPLGVLGVLLSPFLGRWLKTGDPRVFASFAFAVWIGVALWRSGLTTDVDINTIALQCLVQGLGIGFFLTPLVSLSLAGIPADRVAAASGLQTAMRLISRSLFVSIAEAAWDWRARVHENHLVDHITPYDLHTASVIAHLQTAGLSSQQAQATLVATLGRQASMLAIDDLFRASAWLFAGSLAIVWFAKLKPNPNLPSR